MARAAAGAAATYATGPGLTPGHEINTMVSDWAKQGEVVLCQRRHPVSRELMYQVQRCSPELRESTGGRSKKLRLDEDYRETPEGKVFLALVRAANMGLPCPDNAELAQISGVRNPVAASDIIKKLRVAGKISVTFDGDSRNSQRQVMIVETGRKTVLRIGPK